MVECAVNFKYVDGKELWGSEPMFGNSWVDSKDHYAKASVEHGRWWIHSGFETQGQRPAGIAQSVERRALDREVLGFESCLCQLFWKWHWVVTPAVASPYQGVKLRIIARKREQSASDDGSILYFPKIRTPAECGHSHQRATPVLV